VEPDLAPVRFAVVTGARSRTEVEAYLPDNYKVISRVPQHLGHVAYIIQGQDVAGWTMEDYVIPRLASGMIGCRYFTQCQAEYGIDEFGNSRPGYVLLEDDFSTVLFISVDRKAALFNASDELTNAMAVKV
jgi:hypothetical protein